MHDVRDWCLRLFSCRYTATMNLLACMTSLFVLLATAYANTEKIIIIAPPATNVPTSHPTFADLPLQSLPPSNSSLRLSLSVVFPSEEQPHGLESWYLLRNLRPDQRYELRICWAAIVRLPYRTLTQPTV